MPKKIKIISVFIAVMLVLPFLAAGVAGSETAAPLEEAGVEDGLVIYGEEDTPPPAVAETPPWGLYIIISIIAVIVIVVAYIFVTRVIKSMARHP